MNYEETIEYLFTSAPLFQQIGSGAYKEGLDTSIELDSHFGHPHKYFKTIHVAGTNGKGSCSHTIAAILQKAGYKVGLYTSPHLVSFRERIRVNGEMISKEKVVDFVEQERSFFEPLHPSFFELTTALAFKHFKEMNVDVAVIEVGLGGRLDCTNIINPDLGIITNISFDHTQFLGNTLEDIAKEKAGIIKKNTPIIIGEYLDETRPTFETKAKLENAPIIFAQDEAFVISSKSNDKGGRTYQTSQYGALEGELGGECQEKNTNTILHAVEQLRKLNYKISDTNILEGFANVCELTGLMGRWQMINKKPKTVCDTGHNTGGFEYIAKQLKAQKCENLRIVFGMVNDKDISGVLKMLPKNAIYYFTKASVKRALNEETMKQKAEEFGLKGKCYPSVAEAYQKAKEEANENDFIYVGGSSFIVADLLSR